MPTPAGSLSAATLDALLERSAAVHANRLSLLDDSGRRWTYAQLCDESRKMAAALRPKIRPGDPVGLLARNSFEAVAAYFAVHAAQGVVIWLNHSQDPSALAAIAADAGLRLIIAEPAFSGRAEKILPSRRTTFADLTAAQGILSGDLRVDRPADSDADRSASLAAIVYTSGSTDEPLGVMLSHRNLLANTSSIVAYLKLGPDDRAHCVLPFYYIYGLSVLLSHLASGGSIFLENRFLYPQTAVESLEASEATGFAGVSTHYAVLLNQTDFAKRRFPMLRYLAHAGDKLPAATASRLCGLFPEKEIYLMYGQTEAAPRLAFLDPLKVRQKPDSIGRAIPGVELRVADEAGRECPAGTVGEIRAKGPNIMMGYWKHPEETEQALRDGWLCTGDLATRDSDGDLFVVGRKKSFLKVGGHRVSPLEIESVTAEFDGVAQAVALGVPDDVLGQKIRICLVEARPGAVDLAALGRHYRDRLPLYKTPSEAAVYPAFPKNEQGKIDRKRLAELPADVRPLPGRERA